LDVLLFATLGSALIAMWWYWHAWDAASGTDRRARTYWWQYRFIGWPLRNGLPAALPFGVGMVLISGGLLARHLSAPGWITSAAAATALLLMLVGAWALISPPRFLQPRWLLKDEARRKSGMASLIPRPPEGARPVMSMRAFVLGGIGFIVFAAVWLALGFPASALLIGLAIGLPAILATRIKR
jgi:hypothetical protein